MADKSKIEWTEATWNPVTGCTKVSPGCDHCYAERIVERFHGKGSFAVVQRSEEKLYLPLKWRRPRRVFVNSMSDLFHDDVPDSFIARVFAVMARTPQHTYQLLTKRHGRMRSLLNSGLFLNHLWVALGDQAAELLDVFTLRGWPLPNVWLGVSVENQQWADIRVPALLETPAAVRWLSCEPLLGPVDLLGFFPVRPIGANLADAPMPLAATKACGLPGIDWVVAGGESGHGARPMHPGWARSLRDRCAEFGVPFFFKQWGEHRPADVVDDPHMAGGRAYNDPKGGRSAAVIRERGHTGTFRSGETRLMRPGDRTAGGTVMLDADTVAVQVGKKAAGRELDGRTWDEYPAVDHA